MRVATRRLRAALEIFEPCFPRKRHRKALKKVKALADALGERRDADVEIALLEGLRRGGGRRPIAVRCATLIEELRRASARGQRGARALRHAEAAEEAAAAAEEARQEGGRDAMKARRIEGLEPGRAAAPNVARIVAARLDELRGFADAALAPDAERSAARHADRRQAAALRARDLRPLPRRGGRRRRAAPPSSCSPSSATCTTAT